MRSMWLSHSTDKNIETTSFKRLNHLVKVTWTWTPNPLNVKPVLLASPDIPPTRSRKIQRGPPGAQQYRVNASLLGGKASLGLLNGESGSMYGLDTGTVVEIPLEEAATNTKTLDPEFIRLSKVLA